MKKTDRKGLTGRSTHRYEDIIEIYVKDKIKIIYVLTEYICNFILSVYFKHNEMSFAKII